MPIYINDELLETFKFPGGECHFNISKYDFSKPMTVTAYLYNSDDIMCLLLLGDALWDNSYIVDKLVIPYLPYARQDRVCNRGEPFSLRVMKEVIRNICFNFVQVEVIDPHSKITEQIMPFNVKYIHQYEIIGKSILPEIIEDNNLVLVAPDKGAENKMLVVGRQLSVMNPNIEFIIANKVRDPATGKILSTEVEGAIEGKNFIIIDDICDGGRTFTELAKVLKSKGAKDLYLYVTHGIFSNGFSVLKEYFKHIYCYHTFLPDFALVGYEYYLTILKKGV